MSKPVNSSKTARFFGYCINKLWLLTASFIILVALLHILLGLLFPKIDRYQKEIVSWVEKTYHVNIDIEKISAEWTIQGPVIAVTHFKLKSADDKYDILEVGKMSLYFDMITSLLDQRFSTREILIDNANLKFYIDRQLAIRLNTLDLQSKNKAPLDIEVISQKLADTLFAQRKIRISNSSLKLFTLKGTEFNYQIDQIKVEKFNQIHQLSGQLKYGNAGEISLIAEIYGDPASKYSFSDIYMSGSSVNIAELPWLDSFPISKPTQGDLSWQFWGTWRDRHWKSAKAIIEMKNASWLQVARKQRRSRFSSMLSWQYDTHSDGYLSIHDILLSTNSSNADSINTEPVNIDHANTASVINPKVKTNPKEELLPNIFVKYSQEINDNKTWDLFIKDFSLQSLTSYIAYISDGQQAYARFFKQSNFSLLLDHFRISVKKRNHLWQKPAIHFKFSNLSYDPWENIPRANGLSGEINLNSQGGKLIFNADKIDLEFGDLFRNSIKADELNGQMSWTFNHENQIDFKVDSLRLSNPDLTLQAKAAYFKQNDHPILSLYAEITGFNAAKKSLYLPVSIMSGSLIDYLDNGIKSGQLPLIKTVVRGPVNAFPFAGNQGLFVALGWLKNTSFKYLPDWPIATELNAKLLFQGNQMDIQSSHAKSMDNQVINASAFNNDLSLDQSLLELSFDIVSENNSAKKFINQTPLNSIAESLSRIDYKGKLRSKIKLQIALNSERPVKLKGEVNLDPKNSEIDTSVIIVTNPKGTIKFNQQGLSKSKITVMYFGKKIDVELLGKLKPTSPELSLDVNGVLPAEAIADFIGDRWLKFFEGETKFSSLIQFSPIDKPDITRVLFLSDFQGMKFDFPDEFNKQAKQKDEMLLTLELGERNLGEIKWRGLDGRWYWQSEVKQPRITAENFNLHSPDLSEISSEVSYGGDFFINRKSEYDDTIKPALRISGELNSIDLTPWLSFIEKMQVDDSLPTNGSDLELVFETIDLQVKEFKTPVVGLKNTNLHIDKLLGRPWLVNLDGKHGKIELFLYPDRPWKISLTDINIQLNSELFIDDEADDNIDFDADADADAEIYSENSNESDNETDNKNEIALAENPTLKKYSQTVASEEEEGKANEGSQLMPNDLVDMDISCINCVIHDFDYGNLLLQVRRNQQAIDFSITTVKKEQHELSLFGTWSESQNEYQVRTQGQNRTSISYQLSTPNAGLLLKQWDFDVGVEDSSGHLFAKMFWQGRPWEIDYKQVNGSAYLTLGKGYLSEISDEDGRIFSLLNLQSLARKLTFDFKDIYQKGFFYDSITGTFQLQDGLLTTEDISVKGNVADVRLYGSTDLRNKNIEQLAVVTPHLTSSLPILAAWAIEPTTGLVVYLLNMIMEPAVEVATRIDYRVHGNFDQVQVDQIDTSKKTIKVEYESEPALDPASEEKSESKSSTNIAEKIKNEMEQKGQDKSSELTE